MWLRWLFTVTWVTLVAALAFYKYGDFAVANGQFLLRSARVGLPEWLTDWKQPAAPLGISFFIFEFVHYYDFSGYTDIAVGLAQLLNLRVPENFDLHDLLSSDEFLDSLHASVSGHRRIPDAIARGLEPMLEQRRARAPVARSDR